jgi:penicillin-binding protein 1A
MAARATFMVLLGLSAVFGVMCGLMLVYSIDLPQMDDLARYRPNTTTELLDVKGQEIGSFALERRVVVPYTEFPPVLRRRLSRLRTRALSATGG